MGNQYVIPSTGAGAANSPQPVAFPFAYGNPKEGPLSALAYLTIPTGKSSGILNVNLAQFGMSSVQSLLVNNQPNNIPVTVTAGQTGVPFAIQAGGTQVIPVFQTGTNLQIFVQLANPAGVIPVPLIFQIFNVAVPPASWVANLSVSGNVNINDVSGSVDVVVNNLDLIGVGIAAEITGGAKGAFFSALSNSAVLIKAPPGPGTFKGFNGTNGSAISWLQLFDVASPSDVVLGTTQPTWAFPVVGTSPSTGSTPNLPPEGLAFTLGLQAAFTLGPNNATAPSAAFAGTIFYI